MTRFAIVLAALAVWLVPAAAAQAAPGPAWHLALTPLPTNLEPGTTGTAFTVGPRYRLVATNVGGKATTGPVTLKATLPEDVEPIGPVGDTFPVTEGPQSPSCAAAGQEVTCTVSEPVVPGNWIGARIPVKVAPEPVLEPGDMRTATAAVSGGGAQPVGTAYETEINGDPPPFGFLPGAAGLSTLLTRADGSAATAAGSHADRMTVNLGFPTEEPDGLTGAGHLRTLVTDLPAGLLANPTATPVRCSEAQLTSLACPDASQVGTVTLMAIQSFPVPVPVPLYNMEPPPGAPAELAFDAFNVGFYVHLEGGIRTEGDFGASARSDDILAHFTHPILTAQAQLWGDPSAESHDPFRGECRFSFSNACPVEEQNSPFLTMPSACSGPPVMTARDASWEEPGVFHERSAKTTDVLGNPVGVSGCSNLEFEPSLTLRPETRAAESPTGVQIELAVPQDDRLVDEEGKPVLATSALRDTEVALPEGMALNPAAADGLEACSPAQIGLKTAVGDPRPHFNDTRPQCPDASKIGSVEVETPLLDHTLPGAIYVAEPYQNPFGTLLGVYVVVDSPRDGLAVKLAGRTEADPNSGRLTTSFTDNPQLPVASFKVDLFGGPRAALRTPSTCGTYTTHSLHTPWSGNPPVPYSDTFQVSSGPGGGPCRSSEAEMPNNPGFEAGTETPIAASYSPFLGRLSRKDGEQQLKSLEIELPAGLSGKLAGIETCPESAIAAAGAKSGQEELTSPSCPASAEIGEVKVGAGAGPAPYYTTGKVYLAPPYKGAPLSGVVITPAVAGPFDLGNVVVRAPAYVDPVTARLTVRSDDFPRILEGIPLALRDARLALDKDEFTLNPSNCTEKAITGQAVSLLNDSASLFRRFQVGGCRGLDYAPRLFLRLRGGTRRGAHPKLRAVLLAKPGTEANTARASVALPRSEFLENAHIRTVCTRVQFAAGQCPKGAIYGYARAFTPLLEEPVQGPVYLRSSDNELPDMVAALKGPPDKPIELELKGRIDSVRGGIRSTFDLVPDQPVSKFILWMKGGNRGLIVNSRNICKRTYRATARFRGQNGKAHNFRPKLNACKPKAKRRNNKRHRRVG